MSNDIDTLNARFGIAGQLAFSEGPGGLALAELTNAHGSARVLLQGAQLIDWTPPGQAPVIWLSPAARFTVGKAVRGGVPVCWPWFGPHAVEADYPAHGFARSAPWEVMASRQSPENAGTELRLRLQRTDAHVAMWPHDCATEIRISLAPTLTLELVTRNTGRVAVTVSEALHTYFAVSDVRRITVEGLDGCTFFDKVDGGRQCLQSGPVTFGAETDRIYRHTGDSLIEDPGLARRIRISKQDSASTVVWNPWIDKAARLGDMGEDGYLNMVCVESGNVAGDVVSVAPGDAHRLAVQYALENLP